jgi:hypothetical protein
MNINSKLKLLVGIVSAVSLLGVGGAAAKSKHKQVHAQTPAYSADSPEARYRNDPYAVFYAGTYVGRDPDPRVRASMIREFIHNFDSR